MLSNDKNFKFSWQTKTDKIYSKVIIGTKMRCVDTEKKNYFVT